MVAMSAAAAPRWWPRAAASMQLLAAPW